MEFDNTSFWKFTMSLGKKLSDGRLFFTKLFLTVFVHSLVRPSIHDGSLWHAGY